MVLQLNTIGPNKGAKKVARRVGRGLARRGKTSGRGGKGQTARSGGSGGLKIKGLRQTLLRIPKKKGFNSGYGKYVVVNLSDLSGLKDTLITPTVLKKNGLIDSISEKGVKILSAGDVKASLVIRGCKISKTAREKIEAAGGKVE